MTSRRSSALFDEQRRLFKQQLSSFMENQHMLFDDQRRLLESALALPHVLGDPSSAAAVQEPPVGASSAAVPIAVGLARVALQEAEANLPPDTQSVLDLVNASHALASARQRLSTELPVPQQIAQAYDFVRDARLLLKRARPGTEKLAKDAALMVREVLALQCVASDNFEKALADAFGRRPDDELNSQLHLARSSIIRAGQDRAAFEANLQKMGGGALSAEHHTLLEPGTEFSKQWDPLLEANPLLTKRPRPRSPPPLSEQMAN